MCSTVIATCFRELQATIQKKPVPADAAGEHHSLPSDPANSTEQQSAASARASGSLRGGSFPNVPAKPHSKPLLQYFSWDHVPSSRSSSESITHSDSNSTTSSIAVDGNSSTAGYLDVRPNGSASLGSVEASNTGHWAVRITPQKEAHAQPSHSWIQELRGHLRRGGERLWGPNADSLLSDGWKGLSDLTVRPECVLDWPATATVSIVVCCVLGMLTWAILRFM